VQRFGREQARDVGGVAQASGGFGAVKTDAVGEELRVVEVKFRPQNLARNLHRMGGRVILCEAKVRVTDEKWQREREAARAVIKNQNGDILGGKRGCVVRGERDVDADDEQVD